MRQALTFAVLTLSLSFLAFPRQAPPTGIIQGIVFRADTEQPITNAQVTLTQVLDVPAPPTGAGAAPAIAPVTTGADGAFAFKDLKPTTYRVAAAANGFVRQEHGQRALNGPGRLLFVAAGRAINDANIRIVPISVRENSSSSVDVKLIPALQ